MAVKSKSCMLHSDKLEFISSTYFDYIREKSFQCAFSLACARLMESQFSIVAIVFADYFSGNLNKTLSFY